MYKTNENKSGISLIVLVITIIVVIIVAAAVILTLTDNNPISEARKATFLSDIDTFKNDLDMYNAAQYASTLGNYDLNSVNLSVSADENLLYSAIPSLKGKTKYYNSFSVVNGALAYTGTKDEEIDWAENIAGIMTTNAKPELAITTANVLPVKAGGSIVYTVAMTGTMPITVANLSGNIKVLNNGGTELGTQPSISVGAVSGTTADKERSATVTINTTGMAEGTYKIKILAEAVQTAGSKSAEKISTATFEIDNTAPAMPTITINPTTWTNGNISGTITKSNEADTLEYSTNGTTWNAYTTNLTISSNLTVYARETDTASNVSNVATKVITTIDKTAPTVAFGTNGASGVQTGSTTVTASDTSGSGISVCQYIWDTQNSTAPASGWTTFSNGGTLTKIGPGTFYLWIKATDITGNVFTTKSNSFTLTAPVYNFAYTGAVQNFTVPITGTYKLETWGASGGNNGGLGAYVAGNVALTAGQTIYVYVGGIGQFTAGGFNGGGNAGTGTSYGRPYGGGGATDIRTNGTALTNRIIVAGGGGGGQDFAAAGNSSYQGQGVGGNAGAIGGTANAGQVWCCGGPGQGGTQSAGGAGGTVYTNATAYGVAGSLGQGGNGSNSGYEGGAGGGGGYYGGGGGSGGCGGPAGGGGSSYVSGLSSTTSTAGNNTGNGKAVITYTGS